MSAVTVQEFNLTVKTGEAAAEIFIIDGQYNRIASGSGEEAIFRLATGLYAVKVRAGNECQEQPVAIFKDETVIFKPIRFSSPAPLEGTSKTHEYHIGNAEGHSHKIHCVIGKGSQVYVFVRDYTSKVKSPDIETLKYTPALGLSLRNTQGEVLVNFEETSNKEISGDPWAACNVELNPGIFQLALETADGNVLEQTIVAAPGWQTQIFLLLRNYGLKNKDLRADLSGASIFMSPLGTGFKSQNSDSKNPMELNYRLTELASQALVNNRQRLSEKLTNEVLNGKFNNPMLGIYGAHLMMNNSEYDKDLLAVVIENLRSLFQMPHPDVEAIALKSKTGSTYTFDVPPMLRNSWAYILEASVDQPQLVMENSLASQVAGSSWGEGLWLVWSRTGKQMENTNQILLEQLKKMKQLGNESAESANPAPDQVMSKKASTSYFEHADVFSMPQSAGAEMSSADAPLEMNEQQILHMVQSLGVPRSRLNAMLKSINQE